MRITGRPRCLLRAARGNGITCCAWSSRCVETEERRIAMKQMQHLSLAAATLLALSALPSPGAPVAPNPKSLLKSRKVLVVEATNWNGTSHKVPKENALAILNKIKDEVGLASFTVVDNVEAYTAAALAPYDIIVFNYVFNS